MVLYHGSEKIIEKPLYEYKNKANDYGSGFYMTEDAGLAGEWACRKNADGFINKYELNTKGLKICNLNSDDYNILNWLALLTKYRGCWQKGSIAEEAKNYLQEHYLIDISFADIIVGYRADDSYFSFAQDFVMNTISLRQLSEAMRLGKLGEQVVLKSEKAFKRIVYRGIEQAEAEVYFAKKIERDLAARRDYSITKGDNGLAGGLNEVNDIYMIDILRGKVTDDELRV